MSLYEQLTKNFPEEVVIPFGLCLIIPPQSFRNEWHEQLKSEGCSVFQSSYNGRVVFMVKKKDNQNFKGLEAEPTPIREPKPKRFEWTPQDVETLKQMREQGLSLEEIAQRLGRTRGSVLGKLRVLKKLNEADSKPKNEVNGQADLVGELINALTLLYPRHKRIAEYILKNASNILEGE